MLRGIERLAESKVSSSSQFTLPAGRRDEDTWRCGGAYGRPLLTALVSIITPTFAREAYLTQTLRWVREQTYPNIEWLVLDDSPRPSPTLAGITDPRIRYQHSAQRLTIGEKRNRLIAQARGEFIAHFDDDDYYAPRFLELMISSLVDNHADFANLCSWYLFDLRPSPTTIWDTVSPTCIEEQCGMRVLMPRSTGARTRSS
jgi:hypothetical protein